MQRSTLGPYELLEPLGRGGMGVVYRARHRQSGGLVALKTVHVPKEGQLQGIRREIAALARLRHPGVVQILEHGVEQGLPWYAMELLPGRSLRHFVLESRRDAEPGEIGGAVDDARPGAAWWTATLEREAGFAPRQVETPTPGGAPRRRLERDELLRRLSLVRRLCEPLAFLHGEGLVHRDLKPGNVLLRELRVVSCEWRASSALTGQNSAIETDHSQLATSPQSSKLATRDSRLSTSWTPVLVDFGLVSPFRGRLSRESLSTALEAQGSAAYLAPEQARGEAVDARADLYALGCILYELLAGRPPFVGENPFHVLWQHWEVAPRPPSTLVEGVPEALDELVLRLLAKEPRQRLGYAADVAAALERLGAEASLEPENPQPRSYVYRAGFHGRQREMWALQPKLEELSRGGPGALVLMGGESGAGKTRLALELCAKARELGIEVLLGEGRAEAGESAGRTAGAGALHPLSGPLRRVADRCRERGLLETERLLGRRGPVLSAYEPSLRGLPGQELYGPPAELPSEAARVRLYHFLAETFEALALEKPLLLVLDDLQWADELTLGFVDLVCRTRRSEKVPWLLLGTFRSEESNEALEGLLAQPGLWKLELGRLEEAAVGTMVADMLALRGPPELLGRHLARHSEGNPFFVAEYVQAAVEEGLLFRDAQGRWQVGEPGEERASEAAYEALALPRSLLELVERRLEGLSAGALQLAEAASVVGRVAEVAVLERMLPRQEEELWQELRELGQREILLPVQEDPAAAGNVRPERVSVQFAHDKIREVAYSRLSSKTRRALHKAAADTLETHLGPERDENLATLGRHWEEAGQRRKARDYYVAAARAAVRQHALAVAAALYRAALRLAARPTKERVKVRIELAKEVLAIQGHLREAEREGEHALAESRNLADRGSECSALIALGKIAVEAGRMEAARNRFKLALALAHETGDRSTEGAILRALAWICLVQRALEEAQRFYESALAIYREVGDRQEEGVVLHRLGMVIEYRGLNESAREFYERALVIHRDVGNRREELLALAQIAAMRQPQNLDEVAGHFEKALEFHRDTGNRILEARTLNNLGLAHRSAARLDKARWCCEQALSILRSVGNRSLEGLTLSYLGAMCNEQGRVDEAQAWFAQSLEVLRQADDREAEGRALADFGELEHNEGKLDRARERLEQALEIAQRTGRRRGEAHVSRRLACVLAELGRVEESRDLYEKALATYSELNDRRYEADALLRKAALERRTGAKLGRAETLTRAACLLAEERGTPLVKLQALCEAGHATLAAGRPARQQLEEAERIAACCNLEAASPFRKALARLERAQAAFEAGQPLFRGEILEDIPEGLRRWLAETGQLP